jgi:toxin YoeB
MILFSDKGWSDYLEWQDVDRKKLKRINHLIKECLKSPFEGSGKPEPLKWDFQGYWSRRIDEEHRLIYRYENGKLIIVACRYHY